MRFRRPRRRVWVLGLIGLIGLSAYGGYAYITNGSTLARWAERMAVPLFPGSRLSVSHIEVSPAAGTVRISHVALHQQILDKEHVAVRIPWINVALDSQEMLHGIFQPKEVVIAQPQLRLKQRDDGTWNLQGLLADPWPRPKPAILPKIRIEKGTLELVDRDDKPSAILRDVTIDAAPSPGGGLYRFELTADGDLFDQLRLEGIYETDSGVVILKGDVTRLTLSETLRQRMPAQYRQYWERSGLNSGDVDVTLTRLVHDPKNPDPTKKLQYDVSLLLHNGVYSCEYIPFPINDLSGWLTLKDGRGRLHRLEGHNGKTTVRGWGLMGIDPQAPFDINVDILDLELDERLHVWLPPQYRDMWPTWFGDAEPALADIPAIVPFAGPPAEPAPRPAPETPLIAKKIAAETMSGGDSGRAQGRVHIAFHAVRESFGAPIGHAATIDCRGVSIKYREFPYPFTHVNGLLTWEGKRLTFKLQTTLAGKLAHAEGTVDNPGKNAIVRMDIHADALPIDQDFLKALKPEVRDVVKQFHPTGIVTANAHLERDPPTPDAPRGPLRLHAVMDLQEQCAIRWDGLPYPITNLTGRLILENTVWRFTKMKGQNAQAVIEGAGEVRKIGPNRSDIETDLQLTAKNLAFDQQLRAALPQAWQKTWATLNPSGASDVSARIEIRPTRRHDYFVIKPRSETRVQLDLPPLPGVAHRPGESIRLPAMEEVRGTFVFDDGLVTMTGVGFEFRGAPVTVESGELRVENSGAFDLKAFDVMIQDFRLDAGLRRYMPQLMSQFTRRLNDQPLPLLKGNLVIGWSGIPNELAHVSWSRGLVVLNGNTIETGLPLQYLQGQIDNLRGGFDGTDLEAYGDLNLDSINIKGQQLTQFRSPLYINKGRAGLTNIAAQVLGGQLVGTIETTMADTPRYAVKLAIRDADLRRYTMTVPGMQRLKGKVSGELACSGLGQDRRSLQGQGWSRITNGDLGSLPTLLSLVKFLKLNVNRIDTTAFDSGLVNFSIQNGATHMDQIRLDGDAFSLQGQGVLDVQGDIDMRLRVLLGREDRFRVPVVSDVLREAGGQILVVRVRGNPSNPKLGLEPLPQAGDVVRSLGNRLGGNGPTRK